MIEEQSELYLLQLTNTLLTILKLLENTEEYTYPPSKVLLFKPPIIQNHIHTIMHTLTPHEPSPQEPQPHSSTP
jgi:hypothetical protein